LLDSLLFLLPRGYFSRVLGIYIFGIFWIGLIFGIRNSIAIVLGKIVYGEHLCGLVSLVSVRLRVWETEKSLGESY
jgi:hypothetical protein